MPKPEKPLDILASVDGQQRDCAHCAVPVPPSLFTGGRKQSGLRQPWATDVPVSFVGFSHGAAMVPIAERAAKAFAKLIMTYPSCDTEGFGPWKANIPVLHLVGSKEHRSNNHSYCNSVALRTQDRTNFQSVELNDQLSPAD